MYTNPEQSRLIIKVRDSSEVQTTVRILKEMMPLSLERKKSDVGLSQLFTSLSSHTIASMVERAVEIDPQYRFVDFNSYFNVTLPAAFHLKPLLKLLLSKEFVEDAYVETDKAIAPIGRMKRDPLFCYQGYLFPAPIGIDAEYIWGTKDRKQKSLVRLIDIEQGWPVDHEDFESKLLPLSGFNNASMADHGAAVLGIILMEHNLVGGKGICPNGSVFVISPWRSGGKLNTADAIMSALSYLKFGDILLVETQMLDPRNGRQLWPAEINPAIFDVIRLATALGIIVIEPAGNGDAVFGRGNSLETYKNCRGRRILDRKHAEFQDSGAIVTAAASSNVPHDKLEFSNFGNRIDCYAWGENILTTGLYPRSSANAINTYTDKFGGTSGAAAIVAGAAISIQSIVEAKFKKRLSPAQMRKILSSESLGTPSANGRSIDKIGIMPDLKKIIDYLRDMDADNFFSQNADSKNKSKGAGNRKE